MLTRLRYQYSFYCTTEIERILKSRASLSPRTASQSSFPEWRDVFRSHAAACHQPETCPGPLMASGVEIVEHPSGRSLTTLYAPFSDWESAAGHFRPAALRPETAGQVIDRLGAQLRQLPEAGARTRRYAALAARLQAWGVQVDLVRSMSQVARRFPAGSPRWRELPGVRPTQWNSRLLATSLAPHVFLTNGVRTLLEGLHAMPEPVGSLARAANFSALAALCVRSGLFGHPSVAAPVQLCARLCSAGLLPLTVIPGDPSRLVTYQPPGWPECGLS